jgi:hypothetical protein
MEKKFIVPASTMLAGLIIWVGFLLISGTGGSALWLEFIIAIVSGGLIFFSGYRCYKIGGPRTGNIFRSALLLVLAVLSYFLIGITASFVMLAASIATSLLIFKTPVQVESENIANSPSN